MQLKKPKSKIVQYTVLCVLLAISTWMLWPRASEPPTTTAMQATAPKLPATPVDSAEVLAHTDESQPPNLEVIYTELEDIFLHSIGVNKELNNARIVQLNTQITPALPQLLQELQSVPSNAKVLKRRMALVDYFRYRMRWDEEIIPTLVAYIRAGSDARDTKVRAMVLADKAELLGGVAAVDPELAREIASDISDPLMQDLAAYEIYFGLQRSGKDDKQAMAYVHSFAPDFAL